MPAITAARITRPARSRISSTVAARLTACESAIASASVPVRLGPSSGPVSDLVEVDVRLDEGGRDEPAAGVELIGRLERAADRRDPLPGDREIDERTVDAPGADHEVVAQRSSSIAAAARTAATIPM